MENGTIAEDIKIEQAKLARTDLLILQFLIWWFSPPAILKGWFGRGFAYHTGRKYDTGMFKGKFAMVAATTGTSEDTYAPDEIDGSILAVLWPAHNGLFRYSGFDVLSPFVAYMPGRQDETGRALQLNSYRQRLETLESTPKLFFHPAEDYCPNERLKPYVIARRPRMSDHEGRKMGNGYFRTDSGSSASSTFMPVCICSVSTRASILVPSSSLISASITGTSSVKDGWLGR
ncbi:NAD(P)H-dependent oxidoreductase [Paralcaligenes ureilyticus]